MPRSIYTLGTGTRGIKVFFRILKDFQIDTIVDVRRFPTSRFEEFKKEKLIHYCIEEGVEYIYFGCELGGYRKNGYEEWTKTQEFKSGIDKICKIAENKTLCIICAETLPWKCHRRYIGAELTRLGFNVIHIIDENHVWRQRL
jgi:uncharacterized protein (DUF488 family)|uniref:DUF488 domain-containing protein n=1 Tax=candidate division WOR-3 bacterium TaxID=2052148 RepID=A0A7V3RIA1_UNCW3